VGKQKKERQGQNKGVINKDSGGWHTVEKQNEKGGVEAARRTISSELTADW